MKKKIKKSVPKSKIKKFELNKVVISNFDTKKVKGGSGHARPEATLYQCSDKRYKQNISPIVNALKKLGQIEGVYYHWRTNEFPEKDFGPERQVGVIAQEVEAVLPEVVHTDEAGYKSVRYDLMTALLIEGTKTQQTQIEALQAQNEAFQRQLNDLQAAMTLLEVKEESFSAV